MYKLLNMADFYSNEELERDMKYLSEKYNFDGFELIKFTDNDNISLKKYIKGYHMRFFPSWLELYQKTLLLYIKNFKIKNILNHFCGGEKVKKN